MRNFKIIYLYFSNSLQMQLSNLAGFSVFFISKILRYGLFFMFLYLLSSSLTTLGGFTTIQMLFFYLVFNIIDTLSQMLFREVYRFRPLLVSGGFDMVLTKPYSPLIRVLLGGPDFIDLGILIILFALCVAFLIFLQPEIIAVLLFIILLINSILISAAFHVSVLAIGILTLSVDHLVMIYRDLTSLMRIPVDFFSDFLRALFIFVIPIGVMFTFPVKVLLGLLSPAFILYSVVLSVFLLVLSISFWHFSLRRYSSAGG